MKTWKKILLIVWLFIMVGGSIFFYYQKIHDQKEIRQTYKKAISEYNKGNYEKSYKLFNILPEEEIKNDSKYQRLIEFNEKYRSALNHFNVGECEEGIAILKTLPEKYKDRDIIIDNFNKIEILTNNQWCNFLDDSDWYYEVDFNLLATGDEISLSMIECEYSGYTFMNAYYDDIDLVELLKEGEYMVYSDEHDNFTINIDNILVGELKEYNNHISELYHIKEESNITHIRPNCIVSGCTNLADTSTLNSIGEMEYYCNEHYQEMCDMIEDMLGY